MRIKLNKEQLNKLSEGLPFPVILERPSDVRGLLDLLGKEMPWNDTGLSKFGGNAPIKPGRVTFLVEASGDDYICDIHPALVQYLYTKLT
ncbi:MAG TPA: hypothetical protein VJ488_05680 [Dehalococcoidia bacterium]|nr:hypothetical protein [Dehalococcoidia bacterium]